MFSLFDRFIFLQNSNINNLVEVSYFNKPSLNLLHFNCSESSLWVSLFSLDRNNFDANFIKIGFGYVMDNNVIVKLVAKSKKGVDFLRSIEKVEIDQRVNIIEEICLINPLIQDYSHLVYEPSQTISLINLVDLDKNLVTKYNLPIEGKNKNIF